MFTSKFKLEIEVEIWNRFMMEIKAPRFWILEASFQDHKQLFIYLFNLSNKKIMEAKF